MRISGFNKLCLLDYPNHVACIIFTSGCNFKCSYCQNSSLIDSNEALIEESEILNYLKKRKGILEGIVISGGEPTIQKDLKSFIEKVKKIGYKVKLDTNGSNPKILKELLDNNLLDYVAMDIKSTFNSYKDITCTEVNIDNIEKSIEILKKSNIDFEFRTTVIKENHDINKIKKICELVGDHNYYLQNFEDSENVLNKDLHCFPEKELISMYNTLKKDYKNIKVRGLSDALLKEEIKNV